MLLKLGFDSDKIKCNEEKHLITSPRPGGDNPNGVLLYTNSLNVVYTTHPWEGNLFSLVMREKDCAFPKSLDYISKWLGIKETTNFKIKYPFGAFYKDIIKSEKEPEACLKTYSESDLPSPYSLSDRFVKDNISLITQEEWGVRYDHELDAILIPIYFNNKLVGCKARANNDNDFHHRWWAKIPFSKTNVVYGFDKNYGEISRKKTVVIFEAEKSVLQCYDFGCFIAVAVAGHSISRTQERYIKHLMCNHIIVAFDEGLCKEEIEFEAKKMIVDNQLIKNKVSYIYDSEHKFLPLGSKASPSDFGKNIFKNLLKHCLVEVTDGN